MRIFFLKCGSRYFKFRWFSVCFRTRTIVVKCVNITKQSMYRKSQAFQKKKMAHTDFSNMFSEIVQSFDDDQCKREM